MGFQAERFNPLANCADLLLGGVRLHDNQHETFPQRWK
jgi:hypothetical protein